MINSFSRSYLNCIRDSFKYRQNVQKLLYQQKIFGDEKTKFCLLIFSCTGGACPSASKAIHRLASRMAEILIKDLYCDVVTRLITKFSFVLLCSSPERLHGTRSLQERPSFNILFTTFLRKIYQSFFQPKRPNFVAHKTHNFFTQQFCRTLYFCITKIFFIL